MGVFFKFLLGLVFAATVLASVVPVQEGRAILLRDDVPLNSTDPTFHADWKSPPDPSDKWHDYSTVQTYIGGKAFVSTGSIIGSELYGKIWQLLDQECPNDKAENRCYVRRTNMCWPTRSAHRTYPRGNADGYFCVKGIQGEWQNGPKRNLLIGVIAGTLEALTTTEMDGPTSNCFSVDGKKACNVGNPIRVNFPDFEGKPNFMHVDLKDTFDGAKLWNCCGNGHRKAVDGVVDGLSGEIAANFKAWAFSRDTKCLVYGDCPL